MDWRADYERKQMSAEEAVKVVKSGDLVALPLLGPMSIPTALAARRHELRNVTVRLTTPSANPGWFDEGWLDSFKFEFDLFIGPLARQATDARRASYVPVLFSTQFKHSDEREPPGTKPYDVAVINLAPPNSAGYCNMGVHMWNKRSFIRRAKHVIAEVVPDLQIAHGDTWVHESEIHCFVPGQPVRERDIISQLVELVPAERRDEFERLLRAADATSLMGILPSLRREIASM